jgi:hypothetical protein
VGDGRHLACPCYKYNPIRYLDCLLRNCLSDTSFVVQHLERGHPHQPIHCPICGEVFDTHHDRDSHIRLQSCEQRNFRHEGLTTDQLRQLRQNRRTLNEVERWYCLWDILYPTTPRPDSPYVGSVLEEITSIFRRAWRAARQNLLGEHPMTEFLMNPLRSGAGLQMYDHLEVQEIIADNESRFLDWRQIRSIIPERDDLSFLSSDPQPIIPEHDDLSFLSSNPQPDLEAFFDFSAMSDGGVGALNQHQPQSSQQPETQPGASQQAPRHSHIQPNPAYGNVVGGNHLSAGIPVAGSGSEVPGNQMSLGGEYSASFPSHTSSSLLSSLGTTQETTSVPNDGRSSSLSVSSRVQNRDARDRSRGANHGNGDGGDT